MFCIVQKFEVGKIFIVILKKALMFIAAFFIKKNYNIVKYITIY